MSISKVAVVTGSNKGIGLSIVKLLLQRGYEGDVVLTSRDEGRGKEAAEKLKSDFGVEPKFHQLDIDDSASIERLRDYLVSTYGGLDVLVNNAGIAFKGSSTAPFSEQAEVTVGTNFFSTLSVCDILYPILRPNARVVLVSSSLGHLSKLPGQELRKKISATNLTMEQLCDLMKDFVVSAKDGTAKEKGWGEGSYNASKVGVSAMGFVQQRAFEEDSRDDLIVNMVHPGYVDTDMTSHKGALTPDQGADAATYLAMLPSNNADNPKGQYVWHDRKVTAWDEKPIPLM